jgi:L-ascorbate metabolism protein UlaG (beta-lactamase superfamily)
VTRASSTTTRSSPPAAPGTSLGGLSADRSTPDLLTYVGHATVLVELDGVRVLTDPILSGRVAHLRRHGGTVDVDSLGQLDAVLVSHAHLDHLHGASLRQLAAKRPQPTLVIPRGLRRHVAKLGFDAVVELSAGESAEIAGLPITATYADHDSRRHPFGPPAEAVGYLLGAPGHQVYFAGDTDVFPEMATLAADLDTALLPVWGWGPTLGPGHLDPRGAAETLDLLRPRLAIPIHWGTLFPFALDRLRGKVGLLSDPPHEFAREAARLAPEVDVRVLQPGEATPLPAPR